MTTPPPKDQLFDVIIIGCGPAGLASAIEFQKTPTCKYLLLEARDRVGGRAMTDTSTFGSDAPVDLGAQWLHHYRPENPLYAHQQLEKEIQTNNYHFILRSSATPFFDVDGKRISTDRVNQAEEIFNRLCRQIQESSLSTDQSMSEVIEAEYLANGGDPQIKRLIDLFFGVIEQYEAMNLDQLSAKSFMQSDNGIEEYHLAIPSGFGHFIQQIVQRHQVPVELDTIVTRIDASSTESVVRIYTQDQRVFLARYVLVTIPLGCLKRHTIDFRPPLPDWKTNAIDRMGFGLANKIFLQFPQVFWDPQWASFFCASPRFRFILCHPTECILLIKVCGRTAEEIEEMKDQEIVDEVMVLLRKIFSDTDVPEPTRFLITRWSQDPFARGSYSSFAVGADNQTLLDLARECHERIYWAGEHANYHGTIGCVDSAFESGQREAARLVQRLKFEK